MTDDIGGSAVFVLFMALITFLCLLMLAGVITPDLSWLLAAF